MKKSIIIIFALLSVKSYSQNQFSETDGIYIGAGLSVGWASDTDSSGFKTPYKPRSLGIYFPVGYRVNNWVLEGSIQYSGALITSFTVGRVIPISEMFHVELLAGVADNITGSISPITMQHHFSYNVTGRLQVSDFYFQVSQIQNNTYIGIGFRGLAGLTTY